MKKIIFICLLAFVAVSANAQFHFGGSFNINFANEHTDYSSIGYSDDKENAYMIQLKPKFYWNIGERMQVGGRIGFAFGRLNTGMIYDSEKTDKEEDIVNIDRAIGWSVSPFFGYKLLEWKIVSVWGEANVFLGQNYNVGKERKIFFPEWSREMEFGFQILPVVNIDLTEKLALQLHLGFISLGWYGTRSDYPEKVVTTSNWDLHKGGFAGLAQGLADYGIGVVKKF